jgi:anaphase-promoting complex subunit 5
MSPAPRLLLVYALVAFTAICYQPSKWYSANHNMPLGQSHTASRHYASIEAILGKECSLGDRVRAQCRIAYSMGQHGSYAAAQTSLAALHSQIRGTLKLEQRIAAFARLIALLQAIRRYVTNLKSTSYFCRAYTISSNSANLAAANAHLSKLLPLTQTSDPDLSHQISLLEIALLMHPSEPDLPSAYRKITSLLATTSDLAQTLHLLTLKAGVFAAAGKPEKGFSIAVRAASRAERAGLVPVLLEALAALAEILNKVGEFGPARELVEAALPQVCLLLLRLHAMLLVSSLCFALFANTFVHLGFRERRT